MKACIYSHFFYPSTGGVETAALTLAEYLTGQGIKTVVVTKTPEDSSRRDFSFRVVRRPTILQIDRIVANSDVIYTMGFNYPITLLSILHRKPLIWDHPDHDLLCPKNIAWNNGDCTFSLMRCLKCLKRDWSVRFVFYLPISLLLRRIFARIIKWHVFHSRYSRRRAGIRGIVIPIPIKNYPTLNRRRARRIFFVSRLIPEKGCQILLAALRELKMEFPNLRLDIIGDGWFRKELERFAVKWELNDNVAFHGKVSDVFNEYAKGGILVVSSLWGEPFGQVAIEAMVNAVPIVVSNAGALPEIVDDGGLVFKRGDHKDLADKVKELLNDRGQALKMAEKGREVATRKFNVDVVGETYLRLFDNISHKP